MMVESNEVGDQLKQYNCPILNNRYDKFSKKCMNTEYRYNMNIDILILKYSLNLDNLFHTSYQLIQRSTGSLKVFWGFLKKKKRKTINDNISLRNHSAKLIV